MNDGLDAFDVLALAYGYVGSATASPATYYSHPTLGHELEVRRGVELYDSWWRWRPGPDSIEGASLSLPWEQRPHSGMSAEGLAATLARVHGAAQKGDDIDERVRLRGSICSICRRVEYRDEPHNHPCE